MRAARLWPLQLEPSCFDSPSSKAWSKSKAATTSPPPAQRSGSSRNTLAAGHIESPGRRSTAGGSVRTRSGRISRPCATLPTDRPCETAGLPAWGLLRRRLVPILAQVPDDAGGTGGLACSADVTPVQDQPMVGVLAELGRGVGDERVLDFPRRLSRREPGAIGNTENVCVDRDLGLAEHHVEVDIGGLATHAGQRLERRGVAG